jgi:hypothetical protein
MKRSNFGSAPRRHMVQTGITLPAEPWDLTKAGELIDVAINTLVEERKLSRWAVKARWFDGQLCILFGNKREAAFYAKRLGKTVELCENHGD